jgi:octanoyl-[GcvH]:protein N-octanoyltransferase
VNPPLHLLRRSFPEEPQLGTAVSRALLERVAAGELPATARISRPGRVVAFGRQDTVSPGYRDAVRAARAAGFEAVERLAGGRAAVYTAGALSFSRAAPDRDPTPRTRARFEEISDIVRGALARLGVDARVGEVPGEYCPGEFSVSAGGRAKLAGIGQRLISGGAHVGAVIVVTGSEEVRSVLVPVYAALGLDWEPATAGSIEDEVPGVTLEEAEAALVAELEERFELREAELEPRTLDLARSLADGHLAPS